MDEGTLDDPTTEGLLELLVDRNNDGCADGLLDGIPERTRVDEGTLDDAATEGLLELLADRRNEGGTELLKGLLVGTMVPVVGAIDFTEGTGFDEVESGDGDNEGLVVTKDVQPLTPEPWKVDDTKENGGLAQVTETKEVRP